MRAIGYGIVGFNVGTAFANYVLRSGGLPWGAAGEVQMLVGAVAVAAVLVFSKDLR